jgi:hypothetical protein
MQPPQGLLARQPPAAEHADQNYIVPLMVSEGRLRERWSFPVERIEGLTTREPDGVPGTWLPRR